MRVGWGGFGWLATTVGIWLQWESLLNWNHTTQPKAEVVMEQKHRMRWLYPESNSSVKLLQPFQSGPRVAALED